MTRKSKKNGLKRISDGEKKENLPPNSPKDKFGATNFSTAKRAKIEDEEDDGGEARSGGIRWPIDEEALSNFILGLVAEDISQHHNLNQEQSIPKDSPSGGEGPGLSIEKHPLISFNGVDMVIDTIQAMTEEERDTYEFSNEYQLRNQARLSKRVSATPTLTRTR